MGKLNLENINHTDMQYKDDIIIFPSKYKIRSNLKYNEKLQEIITIARLLGIEVKVFYSYRKIRYDFYIDKEYYPYIKIEITINKRDQAINYTYYCWDSSYNPHHSSTISSLHLLEEIKRKL